MLGDAALDRVLSDYSPGYVLDLGSGEGLHSDRLSLRGWDVISIDFQDADICADYNDYPFKAEFDCIWCCHVLEHQLDVQSFLRKVYGDLREGGLLVVTVPPLKDSIVGGHVSLWNAGLLLYRLVLERFMVICGKVGCWW